MWGEMVSFYIIFSTNIFTKIKDGAREVWGNTRLIVGVYTNMQARINSILMTLMLSLYIKKYYDDYDEAISRTGFISGIGSTLGMISAVLFGIVYEKAKMRRVLAINNILIIVGYLSLFINKDPHSVVPFFSFGIASFGFYGLTTLGLIIINKNVGCKARGAVIGLSSLVGAIGIIFILKVGGLFMDVYDLSPFLISAILSGIVLITIFIPSVSRNLEEEPEEKEDKEDDDLKIIENEELKP